MDIISEFAIGAPQAALDDTTTETCIELKKLTNEVCHEFNLRVFAVSQGYRKIAKLITPDGVRCGHVSVEKNSGNNDFTYLVCLPSIRKQRDGAKSGRNERESNKISSLLRSIKKNKEEPTTQAVYEELKRDYFSPFSAVESKSRWGGPTLSVSHTLQEVMTKHILGVDTHSMSMYIDELQKVYSEHQLKTQLFNESARDFSRFRRGATIIGVNKPTTVDDSHYYLVADVSVADKDNTFTFHTPLKRYSTLKELPIAPVVAMINTYMQGKPQYDVRNELGLWYHDQFYDDLDIAVGYASSSNGLWVAIPHEAP